MASHTERLRSEGRLPRALVLRARVLGTALLLGLDPWAAWAQAEPAAAADPAEAVPAAEGASVEPAATPPPSEAPESARATEPEAAAPPAAAEAAPAPDLGSAAARSRSVGLGAPVRYTLEGVEIHGNTHTHAQVVLRYVPFAVGDVIDVDDPELELTRYRLLGTGFFREVEFSLRKGSRRGLVVLVIEVAERNTIVLQSLTMGLSADADTKGEGRPLTAYGGVDVAETNLAGTGMTLGGALAIAQDQWALRLRFLDPTLLGGRWMVSGTVLYNQAQDFFGNAGVQYASSTGEPHRDFAVVQYKRFGGIVGVGRDLSVASQLWFQYRLESVYDTRVPQAALHVRGGRTEPIDFDINPGKSLLSTARVILQYDTRDQPFLPSSGWFVTAASELALAPLGSDYDYQRIDLGASRWWRVPWRHVVRLELFAGAITGYVPFFEQYYIGDFSEFRAPRLLGLNFDRRPPPDFLGTAIKEVRRGRYAAKLGAEYRMPLYRGHRSVYGVDLFASAGLWALAGSRDIERPVSRYHGIARIPLDLTANLGLRMDTSAGGLTFALSNVLGFIPLRPEGH
jgi:outer membrane protein assembly factor BamA